MNLPLLYLAPPLGVTRWNFTDLWHQKARMESLGYHLALFARNGRLQRQSRQKTIACNVIRG